MLRSFLTITFRILWRNKVTSFINILSLTIGITAFILIMLYVHNELRYDKFNENYDRIYRLESYNYGKLPPIIGEYVKDKVPEVEKISFLANGHKAFVSYKPSDNPESGKQVQVNRYWADSTTFDVFTMPFIMGDPTIALNDPFSIVLTESTARNLFGDKNPMGETVEFNKHHYRVTGIIKDVKNFHIDIDVLCSMGSIEKIFPDRDLNDAGYNSWLWSGTYLLMTKNISAKDVEIKINEVLSEINDESLFSQAFKGFNIRPLRDLYFHGTAKNLQYGNHGNLKMVQTFIVIAILILGLACINYINLSTARATLRTKEVAMKKVVGSTKALLRYQFIIESVMVTLFSYFLAFTIVQGLLSHFNQLAMTNINIAELYTPYVWLISIAGIILIGVVSGLYPAIYLTSIRSITLVKGETGKGLRGSIFRKVLLTIQFSISIILIIGIITNLRQLHYARNIDLGFDMHHIIKIWTPSNIPEEFTLRETIKERLLQNPKIEKISFSGNIIGAESNVFRGEIEIEGKKIQIEPIVTDPDFLELMEVEILEGRNFSWDIEGDRWDRYGRNDIPGVIFNEKAIREININAPIGKLITTVGKNVETFKIIGVARDFNIRSVHYNIEPLAVFWVRPHVLMNVRISSSNIPATLKIIEKEWKNMYGSPRFIYSFMDEDYGMWWPGAVYDGEAARKKYTEELIKTASDIGVKLDIRPEPIYSLEEADGWLTKAGSSNTDGLMVMVLDRQQHSWPTAQKAADSGIPTVIFSPLGTSFTTNTIHLADNPGCVVYSTNDFSQAAYGMKMLKAGARMKRTRCVVIQGADRKEEKLADTGITLQYVPANTFIDIYNSMPQNKDVISMAGDYMDLAQEIRHADRQDVINGIKSYLVAARIMENEKADAISMDCLGALGDKEISLPCIAWSRMNDDGIPAACEADKGAIASHIMVQYLFDRPGFQQDPVADTSDDTIIGAHCSCPTRLNGFNEPPEPFELVHHHGNRDAVPRTIWKVGQRVTSLDVLPGNETGLDKTQLLISTGTVVDNMNVPPSGGCVVSVKVKFDRGHEVLSFPGFHQLFFYGDYKNELEDFCKLYDFKSKIA